MRKSLSTIRVRQIFFSRSKEAAVCIKKEEIDQVFLLSRVMYKAVLGLHFKRREQKKSGQLAIF